VLSPLVISKDGKTAKQLGATWVEGEPRVDGGRVDVVFPRSVLEGLGDTWNWRAATNVGGQDVDACPGREGPRESGAADVPGLSRAADSKQKLSRRPAGKGVRSATKRG
jgi:hypothetical protein